jgi:hypothetical protein
MSKNLVIVESPAKAKTIEKFLGKDYTVKSSFGHIRDLPKKGLNIDIENNFEPHYEVSADKRKVIAELKKAAGLHLMKTVKAKRLLGILPTLLSLTQLRQSELYSMKLLRQLLKRQLNILVLLIYIL